MRTKGRDPEGYGSDCSASDIEPDEDGAGHHEDIEPELNKAKRPETKADIKKLLSKFSNTLELVATLSVTGIFSLSCE